MRKILIIGAAVAALSLAVPAQAKADETGALIGGTSGAWTGGTIGFFLGGPVGAVIGAWTGGATGAAIGSSVLDDDVSFGSGGYVDVDVEYRIGDFVEEDVRLRHIRGEDNYGYFRSNGQIYVVDLETRAIVEIRLG